MLKSISGHFRAGVDFFGELNYLSLLNAGKLEKRWVTTSSSEERRLNPLVISHFKIVTKLKQIFGIRKRFRYFLRNYLP